MKTKTLIATLIAATLLLNSCGGANQQQTGDLPVIDITRNHPRKEIRLQDIATIEYIPLETTDDVLLGQSSSLIHVSDNYIVVVEFRLGDIFVFDRNGKAISYFNHRGQGPREYINLVRGGVVFDENAGEIFVLDSWTHRILVYSISGEYQRTLRFSADLFVNAAEIHSFDNETLLIYDGVRLVTGGLDYNEQPYLLLSKKDGSVVYPFDIILSTRYTNRTVHITYSGGERMYAPLTIAMSGVPGNRHFGQDFVIADMSSDTIFLLTQDKAITPLLTRSPSVHASEPRRVLTSLLKTDRFILLQVSTFDFVAAAESGRVAPPLFLMYEFETGITSEVSLVNADLGRNWGFDFVSPAIGRNMDAGLIWVDTFITAQERDRLSSELKPFVATLDEEDNPVVAIVTFK